MNLKQLIALATAGDVDELELLSLEGGFYLLRVLTERGPSCLRDANGEVLRLRSTTQLRQLLADMPPVPCTLVQHGVHDEMCGQRDGPVAPLRVPFTLPPSGSASKTCARGGRPFAWRKRRAHCW